MRITDIKAPLKETSIEGVWMKGITIRQSKELAALADKAQALVNDEDYTGTEHIAWLFENVLVDKDGELFEDRHDLDGIDVAVLQTLSQDVADFFGQPSGQRNQSKQG